MDASTEWYTGPLVQAGSRLAIKGREDRGGFHCGEPIEIEIAPGIWIRGTVELDHSLTVTRHGRDGQDQTYEGYYLNIGSKILLIPGMQARTFLGLDWPEPSTPYEGQAYMARYGGWKRYRAGQWLKDDEQ